jgi:hypothetical protein
MWQGTDSHGLKIQFSARGKLVSWRRTLSVHVILRFEPIPGKEAAFRDELLRVNQPSRAEIG